MSQHDITIYFNILSGNFLVPYSIITTVQFDKKTSYAVVVVVAMLSEKRVRAFSDEPTGSSSDFSYEDDTDANPNYTIPNQRRQDVESHSSDESYEEVLVLMKKILDWIIVMVRGMKTGKK